MQAAPALPGLVVVLSQGWELLPACPIGPAWTLLRDLGCLQSATNRRSLVAQHYTHVGQKRISTLCCSALLCLNEFMPWINIVCELNCLLGKKGELNRILRNLV